MYAFDGRTDGQTHFDRKTVPMHSQSRGNKAAKIKKTHTTGKLYKLSTGEWRTGMGYRGRFFGGNWKGNALPSFLLVIKYASYLPR